MTNYGQFPLYAFLLGFRYILIDLSGHSRLITALVRMILTQQCMLNLALLIVNEAILILACQWLMQNAAMQSYKFEKGRPGRDK